MTGGTMKKKARNKYFNKKITVDGIIFASRAEADYYCRLKLLKQAGEIKDFELQPRFEILPAFSKQGKKYKATTYTADFLIRHNDDSQEVIEVKGYKTQDYRLRMKLFNFTHRDIKFTEIEAR